MNSFDERKKKAFDFASDSAKQLITLAIAIITVTISFAKDVFKTESSLAKYCLAASWFIYLSSILFGIMALLALTGELEPSSSQRVYRPPSIQTKSIKNTFFLQIGAFLLATFFAIIFGILSIFTPVTSSSLPNQKPTSPSTPLSSPK